MKGPILGKDWEADETDLGHPWKGQAEVLPIKTEKSNFIYRNPSFDIPDMPGERIEPGHIRAVWQPTARERDDITQGLNVELNIFAEPIPPVSLNVTYEGATLLVKRPAIVAERFIGDDGRWYVQMLSEHGAMLGVSQGYAREWSARFAQRRLKRILPELKTWPQ